MSIRQPRQPSYRQHKPTGQAVVTIDNKDRYLGKFGSLASKAEYDRLIAEWLAGGRMLQPDPDADLLVNELVTRYTRYAEGYYRKNGKPTSPVKDARYSLQPMSELYGDTPAREFGPSKLKAVRQKYIDAGLCRNEVNRRHQILLRCFRWAVSEEMIPVSVLASLETVPGLKRGRTDVRESPEVGPVDDVHVDAVKDYVSRVVWGMIEVQRTTGARPGEVIIMRTCDISPDGRWYTPDSHKTEHHGKERRIYLGPGARAILAPWLRPDAPEAFLFSPYDSLCDLRARKRTKPVPKRRRLRPGKRAGKAFDPSSYSRAIAEAVKKVNVVRAQKKEPLVPHWHPHQLRHTVAGRINRELDMDTARVVLGHSSVKTTNRYVQKDYDKAAEAMEKLG